MRKSDGALQYRRLRAPARHGEKLIDPPLAEVPRLIAANRELFDAVNCDFHGQSRRRLADLARSQMVEDAIVYTSRWQSGEFPRLSPDAPLLMTGHQPALFHPGVWIKNFVLARLARQEQALAINLLIDSDVLGAPAIGVPTGSLAEPSMEAVAFDRRTEEVPYEERQIVDRETFLSFGERAAQTLRPLIAEPLLRKLWPMVAAAATSDPHIGHCFAAGRHAIEAAWGVRTLELPLSMVCDTLPFRWFAAHILAELPRFRDIHNEALSEYRRVHRLRSRTHPVPELAATDDWWEAPFWLWSRDAPQRRRLFARRVSGGLEISDWQATRFELPLSGDSSAEASVFVLESAARQGLKLRPRALITTLYVRLILCDLFLHGIGGAKYDQLTDAIMQRFFGFEPPQFLTVSGTAKLPLTIPEATRAELLAIDCELRDLRFNPQRYVVPASDNESLLLAKQNWLFDSAHKFKRRERHTALADINAQLQHHVAERREQLQRRRADVVRELRIARLLGSREFSFALYPEETLCPFLLDNY